MRAGDVIWNPLTGEKAILVETPEMTGGAYMVVDAAVEEGGFVPGGEHAHDNAAEHFEVTAGRIAFLVDGVEHTLGPGERVTVPAGAWHRWWNAGEGEVRFRVRVEPALRTAEAISVMWGLCADGHTDAQGRPSPLLGALLATRYRPEVRFREPPALVQRLLFPPLAALARLRGLDRKLDRYADPATHPSAAPGLGRFPDESVMR